MTSLDTIYLGNCVDVMKAIPGESVDLVFADPPFNINLKYDVYDDAKTADDYLAFSNEWMAGVHRILKPTGSFFLAIGDDYAAELAVIARRKLGFNTRNWIIWHYTFGQQTKKKFARSHTHIFYYTKQAKGFTFNPDAVKVPSARQTKYGDKRAAAGGKMPDDVWEFSRVCGTFKERIVDADGSSHPCQMPIAVLDRIIKCASNPSDVVFDPFCGTGTTLDAAHRLDRRFVGCDLSLKYVRVSAQRVFGDPERFNMVRSACAEAA